MKQLAKKAVAKEENTKSFPFWRCLFSYTKGHRKSIVIAAVLSFIAGIAMAIQPLVIKYIVDDGIGAGNPSDPWLVSFFRVIFGHEGIVTQTFQIQIIASLTVFYILVAAIRFLTWTVAANRTYIAMEGTLFNVRSSFFRHVQHLCMRFYDKKSSGELYNCVMGSPMANIRAFLQSCVIGLPHQIVFFVISMIALVSYDWRLTLILLATSGVIVLLTRLSKAKIRASSRAYLSAEKEASTYITDMLKGADSVKMYAIEEDTVHKFDTYLDEMKNRGAKHSFSIMLGSIRPEFVQYLGIAVVYLVGGIYCVTNGLTVGILYAFLSSMTSILSTLIGWSNLSLTHATAEVALQKIEEVLAEHSSTPEKDAGLRSVEVERLSAISGKKPCISFENVHFAYDKREIFHGLGCNIRYGESIGLVGSSGSGKSTFTKLIMRLYDIDSGKISVHGRDVKDFPLHDLRLSFGVVPQSPFIFRGTIWDNIRLARPDASNYEIIKAMEVAHVHEFVNQLPMGWATVIGDGALGLSGGQKQRIAIARAVLKNPDILIFDEATSALDNISERMIQKAMEELMKTHTVIIIAHRLTTVKNVDRILVFDEGEIVEEGNFTELANRNGLFRKLLDTPDEKEEIPV